MSYNYNSIDVRDEDAYEKTFKTKGDDTGTKS